MIRELRARLAPDPQSHLELRVTADVSANLPQESSATAPVTAEGETFASARLRPIGIDPPASGKSVSIVPGLRWARIALPLDLNHINVWLIETADGCVVVDTGMAAPASKESWESLEREWLATQPPRAVFVTHIHPDHIGLAAWLQDRHHIPVWMSARTHQLGSRILSGGPSLLGGVDAFLRSHGFLDTSQVEPLLRPERLARMASGLPRVEREVVDGDVLQWGGSEWIALETNGHAEGHLCLFEPARRVLISGDQVLPTISPNISFGFRGGDPNPLASYLSSLTRLRELPADTLVLPSHGMPFQGLQQRIDDLRSHHEEQLETLARACNEPKTASELLPVMFRRELRGMHLYLALGEALAHLEYLVHAGRVLRLQDAGVVRYVTRQV